MGKNSEHKLIPVELPDDELFYQRPFFAYGIFKEGQLAYSKIEDFTEQIEPGDIPRKLYIRDGLPVILGEDDENYNTKGDKVYFNEKKKAYEIISNTQPGNIFKWDTKVIGDETFNILITENIEGTFVNVDKDGNYLDDFDGSDDPFFSRVPSFIDNELKKIDVEDDDSIFKIQMYYMLLWSAIDRYCTLKYDVSNKQSDYLKKLSEDEVFIEAFESVRPKARDEIRSAINASPFYFNRRRKNYIINYYYTIRSNVVHRGKEGKNNIDALKDSLYDLLDIFNEMIKNTFKS